eukprot:809088_1
MLGEDNRVLKGSNRDNEAQLHSFDQETQELKLQLMKKESEAVLMNARLENAEANFGKKVLEIQKQSEKEVSDSQHQRLQEQTRLNKELNTLKQSLDVESGNHKIASRHINELEESLRHQEKMNSDLHAEVESQNRAIAEQSENYRAKILGIMKDVERLTAQTPSVDDGQGKSTSSQFLGDHRKISKGMYDELLDTHLSREREISDENQDLRLTNSNLMLQLKKLLHFQKILSDRLEDVSPENASSLIDQKFQDEVADTIEDEERVIRDANEKLKHRCDDLCVKLERQ